MCVSRHELMSIPQPPRLRIPSANLVKSIVSSMRWAMALIYATGVICALHASTQSKSQRAKPAGKISAHPHARRSKSRSVRHPKVAAYQLQPAPERYHEIQKALADRGYFKGEANGQWGPDSVDALQRFQTDQKISNDGKINSLSLIALGLGPKHDSAASAPAPTTGDGAAPVTEIPPH